MFTHAHPQTKDTAETVTAELGSNYGKDDDLEVLRSQLERNISRCADPYQSHASVNFGKKLTTPRAKHPHPLRASVH